MAANSSFPMNSRSATCAKCGKESTKAQTRGVPIGRTHHKTLERIPKDTKVYGWPVFNRVCKNGCN
jgi:hypothetical protein